MSTDDVDNILECRVRRQLVPLPDEFINDGVDKINPLLNDQRRILCCPDGDQPAFLSIEWRDTEVLPYHRVLAIPSRGAQFLHRLASVLKT